MNARADDGRVNAQRARADAAEADAAAARACVMRLAREVVRARGEATAYQARLSEIHERARRIIPSVLDSRARLALGDIAVRSQAAPDNVTSLR